MRSRSTAETSTVQRLNAIPREPVRNASNKTKNKTTTTRARNVSATRVFEITRRISSTARLFDENSPRSSASKMVTIDSGAVTNRCSYRVRVATAAMQTSVVTPSTDVAWRRESLGSGASDSGAGSGTSWAELLWDES